MPGKVKVKIVSGRNLPIMDRSNLTTDAYVEVKLGSSIYKTDVYRKSLHPVWNSEWFRFEMDDLELQDEPLQIRLMDHDTYSSNDAIGKVYLDLNPLLCNSSRGKDTSGKMISGWIPVYDTMHGIRGEVNLIVKVELFSDLNKFRQSSCGVRFFFTQSVPEGYIAHTMKGFVEELVVNDDPEYQWIDKIRTPRASNEARQTLFSKLSGEVQRKVGLKALELGGNAVIGYKQCFDLEGESGIVVRGIGTAAYLTRQYESQLSPTCGETLGMSRESPIPEELLCDRSTPTQSNLNQPNTLTGGMSNYSVSTITNSIAQHTPTSATVNAVNFYNNPQSETSTSMNANNNTTTSNLTNNNSRAMVGGGRTNHSLSRGAHSSDDSSLVARQDNGNSAATTLDETATKTSLVSKSPCPPYPSSTDPHKNLTRNGLSHHHRQGSKDKNPVAQTAQDTALNIVTSQGDEHSQPTNKNGSLNYNKAAPKNPVSTAYFSQQGVRSQSLASNTGSQFSGHGQSNVTTTIITSATGTVPLSHSMMGTSGGALYRRSSESDLSTPPKPSNLCAHMRSFPPGMKPGITAVDQYGLMEYPFITISQFPPGFLTHIGGTVTARSVKLLERISNLEEPESRDAWWNEIRMEIRAHCRAFGCTVVVGYEEHTTMCDDVCVLSASGTAAIATTTIGLKSVELLTVSSKHGPPSAVIADAPCHGRGFGVDKDRAILSKLDSAINTSSNGAIKHIVVTTTPSKLRHDSDSDPSCSILHIPTNPVILPFPVKMSRCHVCRKGRVPDVLIVTVDVPPGLHITGKGTLIQAQVFRPKKDCKGEISAKEVSDSLPFLEYELHRRLINKLKVKGMNAIFGLKVQICLGDKLMVAVATGTAMYVTALPPPGVPIITAGNLKTDAQKVLQYQKVVQEAYDRNRQHYDLKSIPVPANGRHSGSSDGEDSDEDENSEIQCGTKDTYILEVDDAEDIDIISMLIDPHPTTGFLMNNIDYLHGYEEHHVSSQQMFTQVWRCRIPTLSLRQFTAYFERLIRSVSFKLRKMMPCVLTNLSFRVELPEPDEMQIAIIGLALGMVDPVKIAAAEKAANPKSGSILAVAKDDGEMIFPLEDDGSNSSGQGSMTRQTDTPGGAGSDGATKDVPRTTPPPLGILVPAVGQTNNSAAARHYAISSSSPHSLGCGQVGTNCCGHANGSGSATPSVPPQQPKSVSGGSGNLASSSSSIPPGHGVNYSFRGGTHSHPPPFSRSSSSSKVIPKPGPLYSLRPKFVVEITPLAYIPGARIEKYLGNLNFFFIRETTSIRENGGLSGFVHNFVAEVLAIVRAHVAALGGNAMVSYFMTELALLHNPHKNQGQCLINVGGDVVLIVHPSSIPDENQMGS